MVRINSDDLARGPIICCRKIVLYVVIIIIFLAVRRAFVPRRVLRVGEADDGDAEVAEVEIGDAKTKVL